MLQPVHTDKEDNDFTGSSSESESNGSETDCVEITNEEVSSHKLVLSKSLSHHQLNLCIFDSLPTVSLLKQFLPEIKAIP